MSVGRKLSSEAGPMQKSLSGWAGSSLRPSSPWPALSEGTVPLLDDLERMETEEKEARWRVITGRGLKFRSSRERSRGCLAVARRASPAPLNRRAKRHDNEPDKDD
jgi:hypothetical protein